MKTEKMSFTEWTKENPIQVTAWKTLDESYNKFATERYNAYQAYLAEPEKVSLKWEDIVKKVEPYFYISTHSEILQVISPDRKLPNKMICNSLPTKEIAEQELARIQWQMIAWTANEGRDVVSGYFVYKQTNNNVAIELTGLYDGNIGVIRKKDCEEAYEQNREIVHQMLNIKTE